METKTSVLKIKKDSENAAVFIDNESLFSILEKSIPEQSFTWKDKKYAMLDEEELKRSATQSGEHTFFYCKNCSESGVKMGDDLLLRPFQVSHDSEFTYWKVLPPGSGFVYEESEPLVFKFHTPQYKEALLSAII